MDNPPIKWQGSAWVLYNDDYPMVLFPLVRWYSNDYPNGLSLNIEKNNFMVFSSTGNEIPCDVKIVNTVIKKT